jgi:hypothetical protein
VLAPVGTPKKAGAKVVEAETIRSALGAGLEKSEPEAG